MKNRHIRIAYLMSGIFYGGAAKSLYLLLSSLDKNIYKIYLFPIACKAADMKEDFLKHAKHFEIVDIKTTENCVMGKSSYYRFKLNSLSSYKRFVDILNEHNIDILHVNTTVFPHIYKWVKKYSKIKIITHARELIPKFGNGTIQKYMIGNIKKYSDVIIAISNNEAKYFSEFSTLHVIPNPFDFNEIKSIQSVFRKEHNIDNNTIIIGMMGTFSRSKGHLNFLSALSTIIKTNQGNNKFLFLIIGVKPKRPLWKRFLRSLLLMENYRVIINKYIKTNNLGEYIKLIPYTNNVLRILKEIDIYVRPSLSGDPWGRDVIESMALSKPIIATGESEFFIENGKTGYLVPPNNPVKLAEKILELIIDPEKRGTFGKCGYEKIKKMCDLDEYGKKINKIYLDLMNN